MFDVPFLDEGFVVWVPSWPKENLGANTKENDKDKLKTNPT
jgi:hypothetical protein